MLRIGDFSRLGQVTVKALRHWDEEELLKPAHVDPWTGYRFYVAAQLRDVQRILVLKALGRALSQIRSVLGEQLSVAELRRMLLVSEEQLRAHMAQDAAQLAAIKRWKRTLEGQLKMPTYDIVRKTVESRKVASIRATVRDLDALALLFPELTDYVRSQGASIVGPGMILYHTCEFRESDLEAEVAFPVTGALNGSGRITVREEPPIEIASLVYTGSFEEVRGAHAALGEWIDASGCELAGPHRIVFLDCGDQNGVGAVVEIQYPIA